MTVGTRWHCGIFSPQGRDQCRDAVHIYCIPTSAPVFEGSPHSICTIYDKEYVWNRRGARCFTALTTRRRPHHPYDAGLNHLHEIRFIANGPEETMCP